MGSRGRGVVGAQIGGEEQGRQGQARTDVDRAAAEAAKRGRDLRVDRQLDAELRLADAGHAAFLSFVAWRVRVLV